MRPGFLVASAAAGVAASLSCPSLTVSLSVFSGSTDPSWKIPEPSEKLCDALLSSDPLVAKASDKLGYAGFIVSADNIIRDNVREHFYILIKSTSSFDNSCFSIK